MPDGNAFEPYYHLGLGSTAGEGAGSEAGSRQGMRRAQRFAQLPTQTHQASGQQPQGLPLRRGHDAFHEKRIHEEEEELIKEVALCASSGRCGRSLAAAACWES